MGNTSAMRIEGWEKRLADYIEAAKDAPFVWGSHDCALWSALWLKECTGKDFAQDWLGLYSTEEEAHNLIASRGYLAVSDIADDHLEIRPVILAQRGDLVLHPTTGALGICAGRTSYFAGIEGQIEIPTTECARAWKVG